MDKLIIELTKLFKEAVTESYYRKNMAEEVVYPYLVYTVSGEPLRVNANGFYVDVDVFDNMGSNDERIESAVYELMRQLENKSLLTEELLLQIAFKSSTPIPTGSDTLQRRNIQFYAKIDWRK